MGTTNGRSVSIIPYLGRSLLAGLAAFGVFFFLFPPRDASTLELLERYVLVPVLTSAIFVVQELREWRRLSAIARRGLEANGTVQAVRRSLWWGPIARISYAFNGTDYSQEVRIPRNQAKDIEVGNELPLLVDPEAPARFAVNVGA